MWFFKKKNLKQKKENCVLCEMINGENKKLIIAENEFAIALLSNDPISDGHILIASKKHIVNLQSCDALTLMAIFNLIKYVGKIINDKLKPNGFNFLFNENYIAGQKYNHFYFNIIPKYKKDEGLLISTNKYNEYVDLIYDKIVKKNKTFN